AVASADFLDAVLDKAHTIERVDVPGEDLKKDPTGRSVIDEQCLAAVANDGIEGRRSVRIRDQMGRDGIRLVIRGRRMSVPIMMPIAKLGRELLHAGNGI